MNEDQDNQDGILLGEMDIRFVLTEARTVVQIGLPNTEDISLVELLGAIELAKDTALKHYAGEIEGDGV